MHPGESPSSHVLNGMLLFLLGQGQQAAALRRHFVFKFIPMLNPDGVVHGHYRTDTFGCNLNRVYAQPDPVSHPTIYAARELFLQLHRTGQLLLYIDLHAHANKRGCFFYGNALEGPAQIENVLFAKLSAMNCHHIDLSASNFSSRNMYGWIYVCICV